MNTMNVGDVRRSTNVTYLCRRVNLACTVSFAERVAPSDQTATTRLISIPLKLTDNALVK